MQSSNLTWQYVSDSKSADLNNGIDAVLMDKSSEGYQSLIIHEMKKALSNDEFELYYQPQVDAKNGKLVGFEALIRWKSPVLGMVTPDVFIPLAESDGCIKDIGGWVIDTACKDLALMNRNGLRNIHMAINISPIQIHDTDICHAVKSATECASVNPSDIHLELTETALINNTSSTHEKVTALKDYGVEIWLDDFGTGYASLSLLRRYPINGLKIDKSFVLRVESSDADFTICSAIVAMAQRLGLRLVAEGIENNMQMQIISQLGCDTLQGYLISKPVDLGDTILKWS